MIVDSDDVSRWFGEYLDAFAACGRGERDTASLLAYYGVPLLVTGPRAAAFQRCWCTAPDRAGSR